MTGKDSVTKRLEIQIKDRIESQASHLMRTYENEELKYKIIELATEWFFKGIGAASQPGGAGAPEFSSNGFHSGVLITNNDGKSDGY